MLLPRNRLLSRCGPHKYATRATVEADPRRVIDGDFFLVDVRDANGAEIIDRPVVGEHAVGPTAAQVTRATVAEAVINAAVKADMRPPIAGVPNINAVAKGPITGCPQ